MLSNAAPLRTSEVLTSAVFAASTAAGINLSVQRRGQISEAKGHMVEDGSIGG